MGFKVYSYFWDFQGTILILTSHVVCTEGEIYNKKKNQLNKIKDIIT